MNFVHKALIKRQGGGEEKKKKSRHVHFYTMKLTINQDKFYSN